MVDDIILDTEEEIAKIDLTNLSDEEFSELVQKKNEKQLQSKLTSNGLRQRVILRFEVESYILLRDGNFIHGSMKVKLL